MFKNKFKNIIYFRNRSWIKQNLMELDRKIRRSHEK